MLYGSGGVKYTLTEREKENTIQTEHTFFFGRGGFIMDYKKMIIEMLEEIDNEDFLFKIYHYILAKYRRCIEKKKQGED